ncbi:MULTISPECIES: exodeoxyribonuclease VII small subunit [Companilactobacillus]|jgi:exodeoxyribonuclease VII small subunit|uniref:Exodeoxyribonuclease 7 small subunit n=1 Tax=Companilactobacillus pabuli TaxID=2714036 RepID=A0A7L7KX28_9LACO|nr:MULTISPECIES: exodeoxyribonuclease VII small subunit [Companilactobacillus]AKP03673.1 exodeoxyribonuclease VII small subunit [Companilactobacillus farciminis]AKS51978.1 exodeoxyribonuclease VII small subunit [Companilactobacillus farciminis]MCV3762772.1 exodeoxyribonuclease VII small subunit [Companilactobacillus farciminis]MDG5112885.1 exodeoxyribonuclease VII small subunit [Companilactobacillus pabuli]QMT84341.1 exodeoxyribonuclease VII small subunit [Companilactobacillus pabuli]
MAEEKKTFEENLADLEEIVKNLETGNVPLEEAMEKFKKGVTLSKELEKTLSEAEETVTKIMTKDGQEVNMKNDQSKDE